MSQNTIKVRVKFSKHGVMRFIGHLDIMRYFQKVIRRAGIDIAYSQGFSPHQIMSFAAPLSVGFESDGEYMDIEMYSVTSAQDIMDAMNAQMADGMHIESVVILPEKAKNAMASVAAAGYYIRFRDGFVPPQGFRQAIEEFLGQDHIPYTKITKKSEIQMDLKTGIYDLKVSSYDMQDCIYLMVNASSSGNIKPAMVMECFYQMLGLNFDAFNLLITREDTYLNVGTEENPQFIPMDGIGDR